MSLEELVRRIGEGKAAIDNGFSRVGPGLEAGAKVEGSLLAASGRVIRLANAAALLCKNGHAAEAGGLVAEMLEAAGRMRRLAGAPEGRVAELESALAAARGDGLAEVAAGIPWAHLFPELQRPPAPPERILSLAVGALEETVSALEARWPGQFAGGMG